MAVARRLLRSTEDAEDAAQETFVRVWRSLTTWRRDAPLRAWILRIAVNVCRTHAGARRPAPALEDVPEPVDPRPRADGTLVSDEAGRAVREAVATLPPRQREVVLLKVFSGTQHQQQSKHLWSRSFCSGILCSLKLIQIKTSRRHQMAIQILSLSTKEIEISDESLIDFKSRLRGEILLPGNERYEMERKIWNGMIDKKPGMIVMQREF